MSERKPSAIIEAILKCIDHIQSYIVHLSFEDFSTNFMVVEACLYNVQVIGEAVSNLPDDVKKSHTHIPWASMKGMRNRLIHEYFGTDLPVVWKVIKIELPALENDFKNIRAALIVQRR